MLIRAQLAPVAIARPLLGCRGTGRYSRLLLFRACFLPRLAFPFRLASHLVQSLSLRVFSLIPAYAYVSTVPHSSRYHAASSIPICCSLLITIPSSLSLYHTCSTHRN